MIVFRGRISFPKLDGAKYNKALKTAVDVQIRQATRAWLNAVIPKVPLWTGQSRGVLKPLGRFLKVAVPVSPQATSRRAKRTIARGVGPSSGERYGAFQFEHRGKRTLFKFAVNLQYFIDNEYTDTKGTTHPHLIHDTPWRAFVAGENAFFKYLQDQLPKRIPKIKNFINYRGSSQRLG